MRKRLRQGTVSPRRPVPDHIQLPPYVNVNKPPGISSGPEIHDKNGIDCMRASGRLAAQVLQHAGTLVRVMFFFSIKFITSFCASLFFTYSDPQMENLTSHW